MVRAWQCRKKSGFLTVAGVVTVRDDAIHVRPRLRQLVLGEAVEGHGAPRSERTASGWRLGPFVSIVLGVLFMLSGTYQALTYGVTGPAVANLLGATSAFLQLWNTHFRIKTISLSSVERVSVNRIDDELTIRYDHDTICPRLFELTGSWAPGTETLVFPGDGDIREVRRALRSRAITVEDETEVVDTTHRFVVEDGAYFCASCGRQVSPADEQCPSCGFALRQREEQTVSPSPGVAST